MIDFTKLTGIEHDGKAVVQIEDSAGRVLWAVQSDEPVVLQVEKQSITSYAGETSYSDNCVLLDIYPKKSNSEIKVTYGGLTKTLTFSGINAMQVYFGTFNGVSDSVATPASGTLTIEGACDSFACGVYQNGSKTTSKGYCSCITAVDEFGSITKIAPYAFRSCTNLALTELPSGITSIGSYAFYSCTNLALTSLPSGTTSIGDYVFYFCTNLALTELPSGITSIGNYAFYNCSDITLSELPSGITSIGNYAFDDCRKISIRVFPKSLISIGEGAFIISENSVTNMYGLTIVLPSGLKSIGDAAFSSRPKSGTNVRNGYLAGVEILATTPPTLTMDVGVFAIEGDFESTFKITVPAGCGDAYKAAEGWSAYADRITEAS